VSLCPNGRPLQFDTGAADAQTAQCQDGKTNLCVHGTHVASIAAGGHPDHDPRAKREADWMDGVAPRAWIVAVQVFTRFNDEAKCGKGKAPCIEAFDADVIAALDYVKRFVEIMPNQCAIVYPFGHDVCGPIPIAAVNLSLGGGEHTSNCDESPHKLVIDSLLSLNVATVISAGNQQYPDAVDSPACVSSAVTVGASNMKDEPARPFSNNPQSGTNLSHEQIDLFAPGDGIRAAFPGGVYGTLYGTSQAAPHVTGAFALLRQMARARHPNDNAALPGPSVDTLLQNLIKYSYAINYPRLSHPDGIFFGRRLWLRDAQKMIP
jgi:subtilisin family serine protease